MRITILIAALLVPLSVRAETLLVEIHQIGHEFDASSSASFNFLAFGLDPPVSWHLEHAPTDVGNTFEAGPSIVSNIGAHFSYPSATIEIDGLSAVGGSVDLIWSGSFPGKNGSVVPATVTTFVPRIGFGLTGYAVTRVTETLDSYTLDKSSRYWIGDSSQTYRLYGDVAVPEPAAVTMLACCFIPAAFMRRRDNFPATLVNTVLAIRALGAKPRHERGVTDHWVLAYLRTCPHTHLHDRPTTV